MHQMEGEPSRKISDTIRDRIYEEGRKHYECWKMNRGEYKKYRIPVTAGFSVLTYIPDESIAENNVELMK